MPREVKLRNFGKFLGVYLLSLVAIIALCSCRNNVLHHNSDNYDAADSTHVATLIKAWQNPSIYAMTEAVELQKQMLEEDSIDTAFMSIPVDALKNVTSVLLKDPKHKSIKKKDIVEEFRLHNNIYMNLAPVSTTTNDTTKSVDKTATDLGTRPEDKVISTSYSYRADTINGKPVKIQIKTIESYE